MYSMLAEHISGESGIRRVAQVDDGAAPLH